MKKPETIDDYIARFPKDVQMLLEKIRLTIRKAAPGSRETISYQIPAFTLDGRNLIYFAAFKNHIGIYPRTTAIKKFKKELAGYKTTTGTIQFPFDKPIPFGLIARIARFRLKETLEEAKAASRQG